MRHSVAWQPLNDFALVFLPAPKHEWIWYIYITDCFHVVYTQRGRLIWFDWFLKWLVSEERLGTPALQYTITAVLEN